MHSMKFGFFLPPFHDPAINPYVALQHDIELCGLLDDLGLDEVWLGEHHSTGWSTLSSAELLIAALARETRRIRFATGVIPLPYHHPLHTAERILLLDHLTDGRTILGCGTGTYIHDMEMIGVDPGSRRAHFRAALDVVQALISGETVDTTTPWFTAKKAVLQLRPVRGPIETVLASSLAGEAVELLVDTATTPIVHVAPPWGIIRPGVSPWGVGVDVDPLPSLIQRVAAYREKSGDAARIRCCVFVHICDSVAKGIDELMPGWSAQRNSLWRNILGLPIPDAPAAHRGALESLVDAGTFIVGDTATCTRMIRELADRLGAPVSFIFLVSGWLSHKATLDQVTALAREVIPNLFGAFKGMEESMRLTSEEASRQMKRRSALR
jgi:limonene 1,2-monooxygenase